MTPSNQALLLVGVLVLTFKCVALELRQLALREEELILDMMHVGDVNSVLAQPFLIEGGRDGVWAQRRERVV